MTTPAGTTFQRIDRGWLRLDLYDTGTEAGTVLINVHVTDRHDTSPRWDIYNRYDPKCSWCWLGYTHSTSEHTHALS